MAKYYYTRNNDGEETEHADYSKSRPHMQIRTFGESTPTNKSHVEHMRKIGAGHFYDSKAKSQRRHREKVYNGKVIAREKKEALAKKVVYKK